MIHVFTKGIADADVAGYEINIDRASVAAFQQMVQRATNLWPDAPAEIKEFADIITNGKPMQNYIANPHLAGTMRKNII